MTNRQAYFCGAWIPESELAIPVTDVGFTMGVTVTERMRTFGGQVFRQDEHLARMRYSLEVIGLDAHRLAQEIDQAIGEYVDRHRPQFAPGDDWGVVAFATPGSGGRPTVCVHGYPLSFGAWAAQYSTGVRAFLSEHRQVPPNCWPTGLKCRSRMHYYLADREAVAHDPQSRAILLDQDGFVGEASTANLVIFREGEGLTTPRFSKVLPGVSVAVVQELAAQLDVPFRERDIRVSELSTADEVWLTSTSICMAPVVSLGGQPLGAGEPGPLYAKFLSAWSRLVGVDIQGQAERFAKVRY